MSRYFDPTDPGLVESSLTPGELEVYEKYWDAVSVEKTLLADSYANGLEEGSKQTQITIAQSLKKAGFSDDDISTHAGLSLEEIKQV